MDEMMFTLLLLLFVTEGVRTQCPSYIQSPCSCSSTRYEAVSIVCDKGDSLSAVLLAIGHSVASIDSLVISSTSITQIPAYAFQGYHIKKLVLRSNGLQFIHPNAFSGALEEELEELEIRGNFLDTIPQTGVPRLKNMKILSLSDNVIDYIPDNSFLSYYSRNVLERLDLSSNNMTAIHPTGLLGLENLRQLSLDKNLFQAIPSHALANVPTLEDLSMGINQISSVPPESLPLPNLKSLSLEVNEIRSLPADGFQTTPSLTYLYLGNNLLTSIDASTFFYINNLKVLSMGNNKDITSISSNALQNLPQLIRLELPDCSITTIEPGSFHKVGRIQVIILSRNHITHVPHDTFSNLPNIVTIDLSENSITHVEDFAFSQLPKLNMLDLSGNRLEALPQNCIYESLHRVDATQTRSLLLHNNPWRCDNEMLWLRKWLRDNGDVIVSKLGGQNARCWTPSHLNGVDLKQTDPLRPRTQAAQQGEINRKAMKPSFNSMFTPAPREFLQPTVVQPQLAGVNLVALVLGCVLGILAICLILLFVIRYCTKSDTSKENQSSNFSSSSVSSGFGDSAYSGAGILTERPHRSTTNQNVFLNRPRYWWF